MVALGTIAVIIIVWCGLLAAARPARDHLGDGLHGRRLRRRRLGPRAARRPMESAVAERVTEVALVLLLFSDAARLDLRVAAPRARLAEPTAAHRPAADDARRVSARASSCSPAWRSPRSSCSRRCSARPTRRSASRSSPTRPCRRACARRWTWRAASTTASPCPSSSSRSIIANAELTTGVTSAVVSNAAAQIGWGLLAGLVAGVLGGLLFRLADRRGWVGERVAADPAAGGRAAGLRHRPEARRQRLHRRLRRRHGLRSRLRGARLGVDAVHRGGRGTARGRDLDRLRRARHFMGHPRTSPGRSCCTRRSA